MPEIHRRDDVLCHYCLDQGREVPVNLIEDPDTGMVYWFKCPECPNSGPIDLLQKKAIVLA